MAKRTDGIPCWFKRTVEPDCEWEEGSVYGFEGPCSGSLGPVAITSAAYDGATLPIHLAYIAFTDENPDELKAKNEKAAAEKAEKEQHAAQVEEEKRLKHEQAAAAKAEAAAHEHHARAGAR